MCIISMSSKKQFLSARWEYLVMINYQADPAILAPYLPKFTELDLYKGKALVSVVGFLFNQARVFGVRWPFHTNFEEVNLRLYLKHQTSNEVRRGVVFISEIVPRIAIATMANLLYHEQYSYRPMKHHIKHESGLVNARYQWKNKGKWNEMHIEAEDVLQPIAAGSEEEFIFEHYWGYNQYNPNTTIEYGVEHERWQVYPIKNWLLNCDVAAQYGQQFVPVLSQKPSSVMLARGSEVVIRKPRFIQ